MADLTGLVVGFLTVLRPEPHPGGFGKNARWLCQCRCGKKAVRVEWSLLRGSGHRSCGCRANEHSIWHGMLYRCSPADAVNRYVYWARGIRVCERWRNSFDAFYEDIGPRPGPEFSIDRKNCDGHYVKDNCRWATPEQQIANKRPLTRRGFYTPNREQWRRIKIWRFRRRAALARRNSIDFPAGRAFA